MKIILCGLIEMWNSGEISANGLRKEGSFPLNRNIFSENNFLIATQGGRTPPLQEASNNNHPAEEDNTIQLSFERTITKQVKFGSFETIQILNFVQDFYIFHPLYYLNK